MLTREAFRPRPRISGLIGAESNPMWREGMAGWPLVLQCALANGLLPELLDDERTSSRASPC